MLRFRLLLTLIIAGSLTLPLQPATITVADSGADYTAIQAAIDAANNGDEILVSPGTYLENINFNGKAITLRSASGDPADTIIDGVGSDSVGVVRLHSLIKNGTLNKMAFTLPVGYRPAKRRIFPVITDLGSFSDVAVGRMNIKGVGQVIPVAGSNSWISLQGVTFRAEQ